MKIRNGKVILAGIAAVVLLIGAAAWAGQGMGDLGKVRLGETAAELAAAGFSRTATLSSFCPGGEGWMMDSTFRISGKEMPARFGACVLHGVAVSLIVVMQRAAAFSDALVRSINDGPTLVPMQRVEGAEKPTWHGTDEVANTVMVQVNGGQLTLGVFTDEGFRALNGQSPAAAPAVPTAPMDRPGLLRILGLGGFAIGMTLEEAKAVVSGRLVQDVRNSNAQCQSWDVQMLRDTGSSLSISICGGKVAVIVNFRAIGTFDGGIELYRYIRDTKDDILRLPGIVVDLDDPVDFKAHNTMYAFEVNEDDDGVWVSAGLCSVSGPGCK